jgi:hypothetical protein
VGVAGHRVRPPPPAHPSPPSRSHRPGVLSVPRARGRACSFTTLIRIAGRRWPVEDFALGKSWFGLADSQVSVPAGFTFWLQPSSSLSRGSANTPTGSAPWWMPKYEADGPIWKTAWPTAHRAWADMIQEIRPSPAPKPAGNRNRSTLITLPASARPGSPKARQIGPATSLVFLVNRDNACGRDNASQSHGRGNASSVPRPCPLRRQ